jgi:MoaA/NifB/PqqE/SkfB family radical SAM enzyme
LENKDVDEYGKCYDRLIIWNVTKFCNFRCPICAAKAIKIPGYTIPQKINIKALKKFLDNTDETYRISFTGGEPLLIKNIIDTFREITHKHYLSLFSNLVNPRVQKIAEVINPDRVTFINASAHLIELERHNLIETFLLNCLLLKKKGFTIHVTELAYPFRIHKAEEYQRLFEEKGIELHYRPFRGIWKRRQYPQAYTSEEIQHFSLNKSGSYNPFIFNRKNKLCNAGYTVAIAGYNGNVRPCFAIKKSMGNIYKKINFSESLIKCPVDFCGCPFPVFEPYLFRKAVNLNKKFFKHREKNVCLPTVH